MIHRSKAWTTCYVNGETTSTLLNAIHDSIAYLAHLESLRETVENHLDDRLV